MVRDARRHVDAAEIQNPVVVAGEDVDIIPQLQQAAEDGAIRESIEEVHRMKLRPVVLNEDEGGRTVEDLPCDGLELLASDLTDGLEGERALLEPGVQGEQPNARPQDDAS